MQLALLKPGNNLCRVDLPSATFTPCEAEGDGNATFSCPTDELTLALGLSTADTPPPLHLIIEGKAASGDAAKWPLPLKTQPDGIAFATISLAKLKEIGLGPSISPFRLAYGDLLPCMGYVIAPQQEN